MLAPLSYGVRAHPDGIGTVLRPLLALWFFRLSFADVCANLAFCENRQPYGIPGHSLNLLYAVALAGLVCRLHHFFGICPAYSVSGHHVVVSLAAFLPVCEAHAFPLSAVRSNPAFERDPSAASGLGPRNSALELQSMLPARQFCSLLPSLAPHLGVVGVVALLAQRREVQEARRFWPVIEHMRRCQNHFPARYRVRLSVLGSAPLATVLRPKEAHEPAPQIPVCRVSCFVLWAYRHGSSNPRFEREPSAASRLRPPQAGRWGS